MNPRPTRAASIPAAAKRLLPDVVAWLGKPPAEGQEAKIQTDLAKAMRGNWNGYEIAKELDGFHGWSGVDAELVELLDGAGSVITGAHDDAIAAWVATEGATLDLPIGTRVTIPRHGEGLIVAHDARLARYGVRTKEQPDNAHWNVDFEDVTVLP